jgi:hypothetical protein
VIELFSGVYLSKLIFLVAYDCELDLAKQVSSHIEDGIRACFRNILPDVKFRKWPNIPKRLYQLIFSIVSEISKGVVLPTIHLFQESVITSLLLTA